MYGTHLFHLLYGIKETPILLLVGQSLSISYCSFRFPWSPFLFCKMWYPETSLAVQWLRLHASNIAGTGSIPGWGSKIPHATWPKKKKKSRSQSFFFHLVHSIISMILGKNYFAIMISNSVNPGKRKKKYYDEKNHYKYLK